jgi:hypothetical protein
MALKASDLGEREDKCMACDSQKNDVFLGEGTQKDWTFVFPIQDVFCTWRHVGVGL